MRINLYNFFSCSSYLAVANWRTGNRIMMLVDIAYAATTMSQTPLQSCTGCVYHSGSTSRWLSWHGISCITWSSGTLSEPASSRLRPTRSPPTSFLIVTAAACAAVPPHNRRSTLLSSRCITPVQWNSLPTDIQSSPSLPVFRQRLKTFLFRQSFPDFALWLYDASVDFVIVLLF